jgi:hypothetical protein
MTLRFRARFPSFSGFFPTPRHAQAARLTDTSYGYRCSTKRRIFLARKSDLVLIPDSTGGAVEPLRVWDRASHLGGKNATDNIINNQTGIK